MEFSFFYYKLFLKIFKMLINTFSKKVKVVLIKKTQGFSN